MIASQQYREDMFDGIVATHLSRKITAAEGGKLRLSVKAPIDEANMNADTWARTHGACPTLGRPVPGEFAKLTVVFRVLNQGRDGG